MDLSKLRWTPADHRTFRNPAPPRKKCNIGATHEQHLYERVNGLTYYCKGRK